MAQMLNIQDFTIERALSFRLKHQSLMLILVDIGHHVSWLTVNACSIYQGTLLHLRPTALQCSWLRRAHLLRVIVKRDRRICPFGTILDPRLNVIVIKGAQHNDWDLRLLQRYSQLYTLLQRRRKNNNGSCKYMILILWKLHTFSKGRHYQHPQGVRITHSQYPWRYR